MPKATVKYHFGPRKDLCNIEFRSSWEANFARILNLLGVQWEYEPRRFYLGSTTYLPDFSLLSDNPWGVKWIEIKGLWHKGDKKRIKLFVNMYPDETIKVIAGKEYRKLAKKYGKLIPKWEGLYMAKSKGKGKKGGC
jgi:predicted nuclease of restriction endonuclease-like RecB superfamily